MLDKRQVPVLNVRSPWMLRWPLQSWRRSVAATIMHRVRATVAEIMPIFANNKHKNKAHW